MFISTALHYDEISNIYREIVAFDLCLQTIVIGCLQIVWRMANNADDVFVYMGEHQEVPDDVTHAIIHPSLNFIPSEAFEYRRQLVSVEMHHGVKQIFTRAFAGTSLTSINLSGVDFIDDSAFHSCKCLVDVEFGDKLDVIDRDAFKNCHSLKSIYLKNVRAIRYGAFSSCKHLADVECGEKMLKIEGRAFERSHSLRRIVLPLKADMVGFYDRAFNCDGLSTIDLVEGIHKTISSFHLAIWKSQMNEQITRVNLTLPTVPAGSKTTFIQDWIVSTHRKFTRYKKEHNKMLKEATTLLELALWKAMLDENEGSSVETNPKKKAKIDILTSRTKLRITSGAALSIVIKNVLPYIRLEE